MVELNGLEQRLKVTSTKALVVVTLDQLDKQSGAILHRLGDEAGREDVSTADEHFAASKGANTDASALAPTSGILYLMAFSILWHSPPYLGEQLQQVTVVVVVDQDLVLANLMARKRQRQKEGKGGTRW